MTREKLYEHAMALYDFCEYPAVRYKLLFSILDTPYEDESLQTLREEFLKSDIVEEMYQLQDEYGGWGRLRSKDYSVKAKIPTSATGINRCLYIGLTIHDRDILFLAKEYLLSLLDGTSRETLFEKNERANPWQRAEICNLLEAISPNSPECDEVYQQWHYIANCAYASGEYCYEADMAAQHEVFLTREKRLVPMQSELVLKRRDRVTRRWFHTFHYINQFRGSQVYLKNAVEWLLEQAGSDGLWDWGPQVNDPWGYFGYFSCNRHYKHNRIVNGTMEILSFLKQYIDNNPS